METNLTLGSRSMQDLAVVITNSLIALWGLFWLFAVKLLYRAAYRLCNPLGTASDPEILYIWQPWKNILYGSSIALRILAIVCYLGFFVAITSWPSIRGDLHSYVKYALSIKR